MGYAGSFEYTPGLDWEPVEFLESGSDVVRAILTRQ